MAMTVVTESGSTEIGFCVYPFDTDLVDYSRFDRDEFGEITVIKRGYSDTMTYQVEVEKEQAASVKAFLSSLRTQKATYIGHPDAPLTHMEGYLRNLKFEVKDWGYIMATLTVESDVMTEEP